jgi:hypothetical protein
LNRGKRLGKLEAKRAAAEKPIAVSIEWTIPSDDEDARQSTFSGKPDSIRINLHPDSLDRGDRQRVADRLLGDRRPSPLELGGRPEAAIPAPEKPRGQRPRPPTETEMQAAREQYLADVAAGRCQMRYDHEEILIAAGYARVSTMLALHDIDSGLQTSPR